MARLMRNFIGSIGGMASRVSGGEAEDSEADKHTRLKESPVESKLSVSSEEDGDEYLAAADSEPPQMKGSLCKWTNYLHGWQERHFVVENCMLAYYKSEADTQYGCRGSIALCKVKIIEHEFDELRFDIRARDCTYFLRASAVHEKLAWVEAIEANQKFVSDNGIDSYVIRRQGSMLSLSGLSQASSSSFKMGHDLQTKLSELETYRDIVCRQVDLLQACFDSQVEAAQSAGATPEMTNGISNSAESIDEIPEIPENAAVPPPRPNSDPRTPPHHSPLPSPLPSRFTPKGHRRAGSDPFAFKPPAVRSFPRSHGGGHFSASSHFDLSNVDFRGEAITFKATTAGIISSVSHCIDIMNKREEYWQKKFDKEQERRRNADLAAHSALNGPRVRAYEYAGPDFEEGPHSALNEEEFFDALEMAYQNDEMEAGGQGGQESTSVQQDSSVQPPTVEPESQAVPEADPEPACSEGQPLVHKSITGLSHRLSPLVDEKVSEYARYIFEPVNTNWAVVHEDGDMTVYRREMEQDGVVVDPLKATYMADGITAQEVINYFFEKETRLEWEGTLESVDVVETLCEDTIVFHQMHKRVWPSTQRETLFASHLCTLVNAPQPENMVGHTWMVCNFSMEHDSVPVSSKLIRATLHIGMVCQTVATRPVSPGKESELSRNDIQCKIVYAANVNPGGWAPPSVVRTIGKRELCKFLKKFSSTVQSRTVSVPLTL